MKMTKHRQAVLDLLYDHPDMKDWPALSASGIRYHLKESGYEIHPKAIHRTLKELWEAGLVVAYRVKTEPPPGLLPNWELHFEPSELSMPNYRRQRINALGKFIHRRTAGVPFFGKPLIDDWKPGDREYVNRELESLMFGGADDLGDLLTGAVSPDSGRPPLARRHAVTDNCRTEIIIESCHG